MSLGLQSQAISFRDPRHQDGHANGLVWFSTDRSLLIEGARLPLAALYLRDRGPAFLSSQLSSKTTLPCRRRAKACRCLVLGRDSMVESRQVFQHNILWPGDLKSEFVQNLQAYYEAGR